MYHSRKTNIEVKWVLGTCGTISNIYNTEEWGKGKETDANNFFEEMIENIPNYWRTWSYRVKEISENKTR